MEELFIDGSQLATYSSLSGTGNNDDRSVTLNDVEAVGSSSDIYRIVVSQTNGNSQFSNGQQVTVYNPDGSILFQTNTVQPDAEQGAAAGDDYLIFTQGGNYVIDLNGFPSGSSSQTYSNNTAGQEGDADQGDNDGELDFADVEPSSSRSSSAVCFGPDTRIDTETGPRRIRDLRPGDTIRDMEGALVRVLWCGARHMTFEGDAAPRPILIAAGALGAGTPERDLTVSPQHRIRVNTGGGQIGTGGEVALAPARGLVGLPGIREMRGKRDMIYVSLLTARHAVLRANGAAAESLYPGPEAMRTLTPLQRNLVYRAVPGLAAEGPAAYGPPVHIILTVGQARSFCARARLTGTKGGTQAETAG